MTLIKSALSRFSHKSMPVVATNMPLDSWLHQLSSQPTRFVRRVELCTALAAGEDAWGAPVDRTHHHTFLRVSLASDSGGRKASEDIVLIERVLSTGGAHHSVTPIEEMFSTGGTLFHPDVHDRICAISGGPSTALAHQLEVERTLTFADGSSQPRLTLAQFAQVLAFVSRTTMLVCAGGACEFQSRSFAFTCMTALAPSLPPSRLVRKTIKGSTNAKLDAEGEVVDDSVFELAAEAFLAQVPWLVNDSASVQALQLIGALKDGPRASAKARLYH